MVVESVCGGVEVVEVVVVVNGFDVIVVLNGFDVGAAGGVVVVVSFRRPHWMPD